MMSVSLERTINTTTSSLYWLGNGTSPSGDDDDDDDDYYYYDRYWFTRTWYFQATYLLGCGIFPFLLSMFGIVTNVINIIVFYHQGILSDNCTPILTGLAVSDFWCCTLVCFETCANTVLEISYTAHGTYTRTIKNFFYLGLIVSWPAPMCKMITSYITFYLALERMVSVTFPFHVKLVFTPIRSVVVIVCIFIITFLLNVPSLWVDKMTIKHDQYGMDIDYEYSGWVNSDFKNDVKFVNDIILRPICMLSVILFNVIIMVKVTISQRFKKTVSSSSSQKGKSSSGGEDSKADKSTKEMKLIKMMIVLCVLFFVCYIPRVLVSLGLYVVDLPLIFYYYIHPVNMFIEVSNSCVNIVVYYTMSTRYRKDIRQLFSSWCGRKQT